MRDNLPPELASLKSDALRVSPADWAGRQGWKLKRSGKSLAGPCPRCGGEDRFAIDAPTGKWNCRGCCVGGYDVISLVMHMEERRFVDALQRITGRRPDKAPDPAKLARDMAAAERAAAEREHEATKRREWARRDAFKLWHGLPPANGHVAAYLTARNIDTDLGALARAIRESAALAYWHGREKIHIGPAMVAAIQFANGIFAGIHRTWLDPDQPKGKVILPDPSGKIDKKTGKTELLPAKKTMGTKGNGAIRLYTPIDCATLVVGEGIETTLTPYVHARREKTAYWCGVDLGHIAGRAMRDGNHKPVADQPDMTDEQCFAVPPDMARRLTEIIFLADADSDSQKTRDAMTRAARRQMRRFPNLTVKIAWPEAGGDFNDMAMRDD